jgi:TPR repeat protein
MYYIGMGVALDYSQAAKWVRRAAEQGYARAQTDLAFLYEHGKGVPLDYVSAYTWYKLALAGGDERAGARMKELSRVMTSEQVHEAKARASQIPQSRPPEDDTRNSSATGSLFVESR